MGLVKTSGPHFSGLPVVHHISNLELDFIRPTLTWMPAPGSVKGHPHYRTQAPKLRSILLMFPHFCHSPAFFSLRSSRVGYKCGFDSRCVMMFMRGATRSILNYTLETGLLYKLLSGEYSLTHRLTTFLRCRLCSQILSPTAVCDGESG